MGWSQDSVTLLKIIKDQGCGVAQSVRCLPCKLKDLGSTPISMGAGARADKMAYGVKAPTTTSGDLGGKGTYYHT